MSRWGCDSALRFEIHQLEGDSFYFYVRTPEMWNGMRRIFHTHKGVCNKSCARNCDGYNEQAAAAVLLVTAWIKQAMPIIKPCGLVRRPLDDVVADIAAGLVGKKSRGKRRA